MKCEKLMLTIAYCFLPVLFASIKASKLVGKDTDNFGFLGIRGDETFYPLLHDFLILRGLGLKDCLQLCCSVSCCVSIPRWFD